MEGTENVSLEKKSVRECLRECLGIIEKPDINPDSLVGILIRQSKAALKRSGKVQKAATQAAKASGKSGRPRIADEKRAAIKADYKAGTLAEMALKHGVGADTVRRIWLEVEAEKKK